MDVSILTDKSYINSSLRCLLVESCNEKCKEPQRN